MESISEKKEAIFESALQLIKEHGFHGAPMSQVAKNAGVAAGTLYHYFESKDHLICELYSYNRDKLVKVVSEAIDANSSYKSKFIKIWRDMFDFYCRNTNVLIFFEQFINSPYKENKQADYFRDRPLYNFLVEGIKEGYLKDVKPGILLVLIINSAISTAKLHQFGNTSLGQKDLDQVVEILWDGISSADEG